MRKTIRTLLTVTITLSIIIASIGLKQIAAGENEMLSGAEGEYFGQKPPGDVPLLFAPDIISVEGIQHCFPAFSPDGMEVYWMTMPEGSRKGQVMYMEAENGKWSAPQIAPFSGEYNDHAPVFSHDGQRLYFSSDRPGGFGKRDIWYVEKNEKGWSDPINLGSPPNSAESETQPTFTAEGTLYFVSRLDSVQWNVGIYRSRLVDGHYGERELLGETINTQYADLYPFIAPDERYLLFCSTRPGANSPETDLYISFRTGKNEWSEPLQLGEEINNGFTVSFPFITHDARYLFFNRFNESETDAFYWVRANILDQYLDEK